VKPVLERVGMDGAGGARLVLDTEAIGAVREAARRAVTGEPFDPEAALRAEFANAWFCQAVVAVSETEAALLRGLGFADVAVLGHARAPTPTSRPFAERAGLLFVGAIPVADSPNLDSLLWFADSVLPLVEAELGEAAKLTVAGFVGEADVSRLAAHPRIALLGEVADLGPLYDAHRVFVAPTRYAAGIPYKLHEAAAMGVPIVASELLRGQLGWADGRDPLAAPVSDPAAFARAVVALHRDEALWTAARQAALGRVTRECGVEGFKEALRGLVG
jgi:glycosyltransferase involved in cell wall biosynthesis